MRQDWNDPNLPWQNSNLPWKNTNISWNNPGLPWKQGGVPLEPAPGAPEIEWVSGPTDNTPQINLTGDIAEGDTIRWQFSLAADFSSILDTATNAVDAAEDAADALAFTLTNPLPNATVYARACIEKPGHEPSAYSASDSQTIDATAPTIQSLAFTSNAGADNTYKAGDVVSVTINWSEAVAVTGTPQLTVNCGGSNKTFDYASGSGTTALVFSYTVQAGDTDANGLSIAANSLALNSGTIRDALGNNATLTHSAVTDQAAHKVDTTAPTITSTNTVGVNENATLAHSLTADEGVTWSIVGGADQARFELSGSTLRWLSNGTKDFEAPDDADTNNAYLVQVRATDAAGNTTNQTITVTVADVAEGGTTPTTWNPSDKAAALALSNGNLTGTLTTNTYAAVRTIVSKSSGKYYCEFAAAVIGQNINFALGLGNANEQLNNYLGNGGSESIGHFGDGSVYLNDASQGSIQSFTAGDVVCMAVDLDNSKIWWRKNGGNWNNSGTDNPATNTGGKSISGLNAGPYFPMWNGILDNDEITANFGGTSYAQTPPSGFGNWAA